MPRKARVIMPNMPHHIVHRGHNGNAVFVEEKDYKYYLDNLIEWKYALNLKVYSYCLMTNHVHLVVESNEDPDAIGKLMKRLAGRQTRFINKMEKRTGSLWDGRYKASPIQSDKYLMQCCRYVELNPVKAGMVCRAEEYPWSSYVAKVGLIDNPWVDETPHWSGLGMDHKNRMIAYSDYVHSFSEATREAEFITQAIERSQLTGDKRFVDEVEARE